MMDDFGNLVETRDQKALRDAQWRIDLWVTHAQELKAMKDEWQKLCADLHDAWKEASWKRPEAALVRQKMGAEFRLIAAIDELAWRRS